MGGGGHVLGLSMAMPGTDKGSDKQICVQSARLMETSWWQPSSWLRVSISIRSSGVELCRTPVRSGLSPQWEDWCCHVPVPQDVAKKGARGLDEAYELRVLSSGLLGSTIGRSWLPVGAVGGEHLVALSSTKGAAAGTVTLVVPLMPPPPPPPRIISGVKVDVGAAGEELLFAARAQARSGVVEPSMRYLCVLDAQGLAETDPHAIKAARPPDTWMRVVSFDETVQRAGIDPSEMRQTINHGNDQHLRSAPVLIHRHFTRRAHAPS